MLSFSGQDFDPRSLLSFFSLPQLRTRRKGELSVGSATGKSWLARQGYCQYSTRGVLRSPSISDHVALLLEQFESHAGEIAAALQRQQARCELTCFPIYEDDDREFFADVNPDVLARAQRLGIRVANLDLGKVAFVQDRA